MCLVLSIVESMKSLECTRKHQILIISSTQFIVARATCNTPLFTLSLRRQGYH